MDTPAAQAAATPPSSGATPKPTPERERKRPARWTLNAFLGKWVSSVAPVAISAAAVELGLALVGLPAGASHPGGLALAWAAVSGLFALYALPMAALGALAERYKPPLPRPSTQAVLSYALAAALTAAVAVNAARIVDLQDLEFMRPEFQFLAISGACGAGFLLHGAVIHPALGPLLSRVPRIRASHVTVTLLVGLILLGFVCVHFVLAPIHQVPLIRPLALVVLGLSLLAARLLAPVMEPSVTRFLVVTALALPVAFPVALGAQREVPFVLFAHTPSAAGLASSVVRAVDWDGDGSMTHWLGGADCAELDGDRGPLVLEKPGDGIDQDCRGGDAAVPPPAPVAPPWAECRTGPHPLSVLFLTIDALRADALGSETTPGLWSLARASTTFRRAYPPSSMTSPTFVSVFTGSALADLNEHNVLMDPELRIGTNLAERYAAAGYATVGYCYFNIHPETTRGFQAQNPTTLDVQPAGAKHQLMAAGITHGIVETLAAVKDKPVFLWAHFPDLHAPYAYKDGPDGASKSDTQAYLEAVRSVDGHLSGMLNELAQQQRLQNTVIVISADHGEQLGERLREGHGSYLFEEGTRVPLILWIPGCPPRTLDYPVSLKQLGSSLAQLTGVAAPGPTWFAPPADRAVVVEDAAESWVGLKRAVHLDQYKLIVDVQNGGAMLFDLAADPGEFVNLYAPGSPVTERLEHAYQRWLDSPGER